ncbi:transposase [Streptomyces sp. NPDC002513]
MATDTHDGSGPQTAVRGQRVLDFFDRSGRTYGSPRITLDLWEEGWQVSQSTVAAR